jgi:hypothetical protein
VVVEEGLFDRFPCDAASEMRKGPMRALPNNVDGKFA